MTLAELTGVLDRAAKDLESAAQNLSDRSQPQLDMDSTDSDVSSVRPVTLVGDTSLASELESYFTDSCSADAASAVYEFDEKALQIVTFPSQGCQSRNFEIDFPVIDDDDPGIRPGSPLYVIANRDIAQDVAELLDAECETRGLSGFIFQDTHGLTFVSNPSQECPTFTYQFALDEPIGVAPQP